MGGKKTSFFNMIKAEHFKIEKKKKEKESATVDFWTIRNQNFGFVFLLLRQKLNKEVQLKQKASQLQTKYWKLKENSQRERDVAIQQLGEFRKAHSFLTRKVTSKHVPCSPSQNFSPKRNVARWFSMCWTIFFTNLNAKHSRISIFQFWIDCKIWTSTCPVFWNFLLTFFLNLIVESFQYLRTCSYFIFGILMSSKAHKKSPAGQLFSTYSNFKDSKIFIFWVCIDCEFWTIASPVFWNFLFLKTKFTFFLIEGKFPKILFPAFFSFKINRGGGKFLLNFLKKF